MESTKWLVEFTFRRPQFELQLCLYCLCHLGEGTQIHWASFSSSIVMGKICIKSLMLHFKNELMVVWQFFLPHFFLQTSEVSENLPSLSFESLECSTSSLLLCYLFSKAFKLFKATQIQSSVKEIATTPCISRRNEFSPGNYKLMELL